MVTDDTSDTKNQVVASSVINIIIHEYSGFNILGVQTYSFLA